MKLVFLFSGADKVSWLNDISEEYLGKLGRFQSTEIIHCRPVRRGRSALKSKQAEEAQDLLARILPDDYVIVCDERGQQFSSPEFAKRFQRGLNSSKKRLLIVVGGPFGLNEELRRRAQLVWSFSPMVLNHHLAQAVALEQVYRAYTILKGLPYHNE